MSADVFCITGPDGKILPPAVQATILAKYSRSPESARELMKEVTEESAGRFQEKYVVGYGHNCYDRETEVLTENGFVPWPDLIEKVPLATLNPDTGFLEYMMPTRLVQQNYSGLMYEVKNRAVDLLVTPNHRMWVWMKGNPKQRASPSYGLVEASEIRGRPVAYQKNAKWEGPEPEIMVGNLPGAGALALMGFFIGDGFNDERYDSAVVFRLRRRRKIEYLNELADHLGLSVGLHGEDRYYVSGDGIGKWLRACYSDSGAKMIPREVLALGTKSLRALFEGLTQSDGSVDHGGHVTYYTTSDVLKEQLHELALKIGLSARCSTREDHGNRWNVLPLHTVHFNRTRNRPEVNKIVELRFALKGGDPLTLQEIKEKTQDGFVHYDGTVYCAEMPRNHILYVRRNGKCVWSGNSVAELANLPVCFENVSIVASKVVETWQRAGYSEKSTRYQQFSRSSFVTPPGAPPSMKAFAARFYDAYERLMPRMVRICAEIAGDDPETPKRTTRARAFDNIRYLLPAGTGTNVAAVMNLRDVRDMIASLRGRQNPELAELGEKLKAAAESMAPTLMKHTDPDPFHLPVKSVGYLSSEHFDRENPQPHVLLHRPHLMPSAADENDSFKVLVADHHGMSWKDFSNFMDNRPPWAEVPDVFKTVKVSFEMMMDFGAFRDLQRHRRCEQFVEPLTSNYGYVVPHDIEGTPLEPEYREAMESLESYGDEEVVHNTDLFQYVVPLGYLHRSVFQMDLKELYYIVELRTKSQGHISYRRIAYRMFELVSERLPELAQWCRAVRPDAVGDHT